eukprot:TRINITY_DN3525_c0_g1_i3.p1 TRINITY_DN3525_c0_g1~~TRINITY_DN3525_c0_g1_i3.p1  ORF type:complete len:249 (+),score=67.69 TRINITY_DN3525_c0_g1_i3:372-1118(+)
MRLTLEDLVERFRPATGFTCSDEITLVYPLWKDEKTGQMRTNMDHDGKVQKMATLTAGYASVCFYKHIREQIYEDDKLPNHIERTMPHFDSRVFNVSKNPEIINNLLWRASYDYRRNSISGLSHHYFSQKELNQVNTKKQLEMLATKNVSWDAQPDWYKFGIFSKKEQFEKPNPYLPGAMLTRTRLVTFSVELDKNYTVEQEEWILAKYLPSQMGQKVVRLSQIEKDDSMTEGDSAKEVTNNDNNDNN